MPEVNTHAPAFVSWVELGSSDPEASKDFYCDTFGWYVYTLTGDIGEYDVFTLGGVQGPAVAGMYALTDDAQPQSWMVYFRTDDIPATLDAVRAAGGQELVEPTDITSLGRMAMCSDPQGAEFGLWFPYTFQGAGVLDEPGALCWVELSAPDVREARRFYGQVFGWEAVDRKHFHVESYTDWKVGDWSVAGMVSLEERWAPHTPPHWSPYFWVSDCDAFAARAGGLGAHIHVPPTDVEPGRVCILTDPGGARVAVITPSAPGLSHAKTRP